jgi:hypothetical protein
MALNLGPEAYEAISRLKNNPDWRAFVAALDDQMSSFMNRALEAPVADRHDATGYARGLRDILQHIELIEKPTNNRTSRPKMRAMETANV